jgi:cyclophilin family peptidyl-prolyl cis-trans isomerase
MAQTQDLPGGEETQSSRKYSEENQKQAPDGSDRGKKNMAPAHARNNEKDSPTN